VTKEQRTNKEKKRREILILLPRAWKIFIEVKKKLSPQKIKGISSKIVNLGFGQPIFYVFQGKIPIFQYSPGFPGSVETEILMQQCNPYILIFEEKNPQFKLHILHPKLMSLFCDTIYKYCFHVSAYKQVTEIAPKPWGPKPC